MRRMTILAFAGAVLVALGGIGFTLGRATVRETAATAAPTRAADSELTTRTVTLHPAETPLSPPFTLPSAASPTVFGMADRTNAALAPPNRACANRDALGVSRVVEIDTTGGPAFGFEHFKQYDFLHEKEVVLTFDDGPWPENTVAVLKALTNDCLKATFFEIGKHAMWHPEITKEVIEAGQTVGSHTWSHKDLARNPYVGDLEKAKQEIEMGNSAVHTAAAAPIAAFFRFPDLQHTPQMLGYLAERNIATFSTDIDSFDFKIRKPDEVVKSIMTKLEKRGKGIILMHDFQHATAEAIPELIRQLKAGGYKVVHIVSRQVLTALPEYDEMVSQQNKLSSNNTRPEASVVRTLGQ
jgi:peptidoglycan/xylan/chitin deacetylase (PgdA/CDA1 family)